MAYRNGNYTAFFVDSPFDQTNLSAHSTKDFVSYNLLKAWKGLDSSFPFNDSHNKNYNVRDGSDWEKTLKPRLRSRLDESKNIILFLSSVTKSSKALREEIDYGINNKGLPLILVYPEYDKQSDILISDFTVTSEINGLWANLPVLRDSINSIPVIHVANKKELIKKALNDINFMVNSKCSPAHYSYVNNTKKKISP